MRSELLLTNGRYRTLVTAAGAGFSSLGEVLLTRWNADVTREAEGWFLYLRDLDSGTCWSAGHQPVRQLADRYHVRFSDDFAEIVREDDGLELRTEVMVSSGEDVEWRRYTVRNLSGRRRRIDVTSVIEVTLNTAAADQGHPAFSKLFVQTEYLADSGAVLARRRPRSPDEETLCLIQALSVVGSSAADPPEYETDRMRFIGRGRTLAAPAGLAAGTALSGTVGDVLDPMIALRRSAVLEPGASVAFLGVLAAGDDRSTAELAVLSAQVPGAADIAFATTTQPSGSLVPEFRRAGRFRPAPGIALAAPADQPLQCFNGTGGFTPAGDAYVIRLDRTLDGLRLPPVPWVNVIANPDAGCIVSEAGLGFTWSVNSRLNRLTPWFNDPVSDPVGEALYLRDEESGLFWSPTPAPVPGTGPYEVRHGFGSTTWRHQSAGLEQEVTCFAAREDSVKIIRLRIRNREKVPRRLSLFYCADLVLGGHRADTAFFIVTEAADNGAVLLARNMESPGFEGRVAFATLFGGPGRLDSMTGDRKSFLGKYGSAESPAALEDGEHLDGATGPGLDPAAAFQFAIELAPGQSGEWVVLLGQAQGSDAALELAGRYGSAAAVEATLAEVRGFWHELLSAVRVETPSPEVNLMLNGWLNYQNLSCRMWARSAFYQSGGAFGFRDQLQDAAALLPLAPELTRHQILLHAAHQFTEGDVLHWWHPPTSLGIRTRFSDDLLWLPYITEYYIAATGDASVLDEPVRLLEGDELPADQDEALQTPFDSGLAALVYDHCCMALDRSLTRGSHGLPLMGSGDWNDGMNRVGRLGEGESVWLGFFLFHVLQRFIPHCEQRGDTERAERYRAYRADLGAALNDGGWDGAWYRRAYYDDGAPLGSASSDECRIDLIAQAWSVLSGAAPPERAVQALDAMEKYLVDEPGGVIRLLTPPFDRTRHDPGYIKGYLPGVRENGGQYTHGALWAVRALAEAGRADRVVRLFEMLTPVRRAATPAAVQVYKTEPYVVAADVYSVAPHKGRGGWTWYTGSAGWMFRVGLESILGLSLDAGQALLLSPCIPPEWPGYTVRYREPIRGGEYQIVVRRSAGRTVVRAAGLEAGVVDRAVRIVLAEGGSHPVEVDLGSDVGPRYQPRTGAV